MKVLATRSQILSDIHETEKEIKQLQQRENDLHPRTLEYRFRKAHNRVSIAHRKRFVEYLQDLLKQR